jgi:ribosomal protein S12 methylthiotransferase accessory factor
MVLELTEKIRLEGAQRACTPEETLERMRPHFHAAGITRLAEITGLDRIGVCVAQCMRPDAIVLAVDSGKGATIEAAKCSAMMEGFERHVGETSRPPHTLASAAQLGDQAETRLPMIKGAVFHPYAVMPWTEVLGLRSAAPRMVPTDAVRLIARPDPAPLTSLPFAYTSNGLSSGNTYAEAVAGGLYECIERDCTGIAQRRLQDFPRVDLDTITDPTVSRLVRTLREADVTPVLIDVASDIGVPAYICYLIDCDKGFGVNKGYAAHLDPAIAQARAITETIQARAVWIAGSRDDFFHHLHEKVKSTDSAAVLARLYKHATTSANAHPDRSGETFEEDIDTLLSMLEAADIPEPLVYEFDHPYPCSVVRVIVPTLEGYTFDYAQPGPRALSK